MLSPRGAIYLDVMCCLPRTDVRIMAFWSPLKHD